MMEAPDALNLRTWLVCPWILMYGNGEIISICSKLPSIRIICYVATANYYTGLRH